MAGQAGQAGRVELGRMVGMGRFGGTVDLSCFSGGHQQEIGQAGGDLFTCAGHIWFIGSFLFSA